MLPADLEVSSLVARPLFVTIAAVLLAGQVPDVGEPDNTVTAAAATLALMTVAIIRHSVPALGLLSISYSGQVSFGDKVVHNVEEHIREDATSVVKWRVPILGDMLRQGVRRGDSTSIGGAIRALRLFLAAYIAATRDNPDARIYTFPDGHETVGWFGYDLALVMRAGAEDTMTNVTAEEDMDVVGRAMGEFAVEFVQAGYVEEVIYMIDALVGAGVSIHQLTPSGAVSVFTKATAGLARVEKAAEEDDDYDLAAKALAGWAVVTGYQALHFGLDPPPRLVSDVADMGPEPPWYPAADVIMDEKFLIRWGNKLPQGYEGPVAALAWANEARDDG
jgi:hypothetical protein